MISCWLGLKLAYPKLRFNTRRSSLSEGAVASAMPLYSPDLPASSSQRANFLSSSISSSP